MGLNLHSTVEAIQSFLSAGIAYMCVIQVLLCVGIGCLCVVSRD